MWRSRRAGRVGLQGSKGKIRRLQRELTAAKGAGLGCSRGRAGRRGHRLTSASERAAEPGTLWSWSFNGAGHLRQETGEDQEQGKKILRTWNRAQQQRSREGGLGAERQRGRRRGGEVKHRVGGKRVTVTGEREGGKPRVGWKSRVGGLWRKTAGPGRREREQRTAFGGDVLPENGSPRRAGLAAGEVR